MPALQEEEQLGKAYDRALMSRLLGFLRPYRHRVSLAVLLLLLLAVVELTGPYLIKVAIDQYIAPGRLRGLTGIAVLYLLVLVLQYALVYGHNTLTQWIGQHVMFDIRARLFQHLQKLPLSTFDVQPVGRLVTRTTNDIETLNNMLSSGVVAVFGDLFVLSGIVLVMLHLNWRLALLTFSVLPFIAAATFIFRRRVRGSFRRIRVRLARINSMLQENISGMMTVQLFNRQESNRVQFDRLNRDHLEAHLETIRYYAIFFPSIELFGSIFLALILWTGGMKVLEGSLTIGAVVAFIQYTERFFHPIRDLSDKYNLMQAAMASAERVFTLLDSPEQPASSGEAAALPPHRGKIEFDRVSFSYVAGEPVLRQVSFTVQPGEKVAIVGATGAGKTTLIHLLMRDYELRSGVIRLDGVDISRANLHELRRRFSVVWQDVFIFSGSVLENIRLGEERISEASCAAAARSVNAHGFIERLSGGFAHRLQERGANLSVGEKQLLSFARALVFNPEILVLDEATSSVDVETERLIQNAIGTLMWNRTSLIIAHRLSTIRNVDRIIVLHKGEIAEMGTHTELLRRRGVYHRLYQLQFSEATAI